jgi:haloacetate dehalogenase
MWHKVAPELAEHFTVIASDLRGYGRSSKPPATADHETNSKRAMARDQIEMMNALGFDRFFVCGHDRGGRCAYRLPLDFPSKVRKLAVLDIIATADMWARMDRELGLVNWHRFFLAQPFDLPEQLIGCDPDNYYFRSNRDMLHEEALGGLPSFRE